jgi:2-hydroxy-6-oxonona-2,4-dienedioate hydrolase
MSPSALFLFVILTAAVIAGGLIFRAYKRDIGLARAAARRGSRMVDTDIGPVEYADEGAGMPLLSIHGAGGGHDQGLANVFDLVGNGFRIIAPSRFGYLRTPVPGDTSSAAQADAHAALLDSLKINRVIVVGASAGARSAVEFAIRHPGRAVALILIVPAIYAPTEPVAVEGSGTSVLALRLVEKGADFGWWALAKIAPPILLRFLGVRSELLASASEAEWARLREIIGAVEPLSWRAAGIRIDGKPDSHHPQFEAIAAPTLIISARDDLFNTLPAAAFAAAAIPGARLIVYETGGHLLIGRQQDVREAIRVHIGGQR